LPCVPRNSPSRPAEEARGSADEGRSLVDWCSGAQIVSTDCDMPNSDGRAVRVLVALLEALGARARFSGTYGWRGPPGGPRVAGARRRVDDVRRGRGRGHLPGHAGGRQPEVLGADLASSVDLSPESPLGRWTAWMSARADRADPIPLLRMPARAAANWAERLAGTDESSESVRTP
jgi:hypothetical protein